MPRIVSERLIGYNLAFSKTVDPTGGDVWTLQLLDQALGREILVSFNADVKDALVQQLTGVIIVPANGQAAHLPFGKGV